MALSFPLSLATFADILPVQAYTCDLPEQVQQSRTAGGEQLTADMAERLWAGRVDLGWMLKAEVGRPEVLIQVLKQGHTFHMLDGRRKYPLLDPTGTILGAATVTILALGADLREMSLAGLPAGYTLSAGDYLSFSYTDLSITRQALHKVVTTTVIADGAGETALFEILPALRPGVVVGAAVQLKKPYCKAVMIPGTAPPSTGRSTLYDGLGFDWVQSLR